jgi:hypothetical protein
VGQGEMIPQSHLEAERTATIFASA